MGRKCQNGKCQHDEKEHIPGKKRTVTVTNDQGKEEKQPTEFFGACTADENGLSCPCGEFQP